MEFMGFLGNKLQTILMYFEMILTKLILYLCNIMGWEGCTRLAEIEIYWIIVSAKVYYFVLSSTDTRILSQRKKTKTVWVRLPILFFQEQSKMIFFPHFDFLLKSQNIFIIPSIHPEKREKKKKKLHPQFFVFLTTLEGVQT